MSAIVFVVMWAPILLGLFAKKRLDRATTKWGTWLWGAIMVVCILYSLGWLFQWMFFSSRWWQLAGNGGGVWN